MESEGDVQNSLNSACETVESTTKVAHDPGWNDPPKLSFGAMGQTKFVKKGLLNKPKRVAFPLNSNSPTTSPSSSSLQASKSDSCLPPAPLSSGDKLMDSSTTHSPFINPFGLHHLTDKPSSMIKNIVPPLDLSDPNSGTKEDGDKPTQLSSLEKMMGVFEKLISDHIRPTPVADDGDKIEIDIRRRLQVLSKMWTDGKLNDDVQQKMVQLAEALDKGQGSIANNLHIELIVDHTSQVSAWMPGIRKLVHCCMLAEERANKKEPLKTEDHKLNAPTIENHKEEAHKIEDQKEDGNTEIKDQDTTSEYYHP